MVIKVKLTKSKLKQIIKEELSEASRHAGTENEIHADTISHHTMVLASKMSSLVAQIHEELGKLGLSRDEEREMLNAASAELNALTSSNPLANVVLERLKFLGSPALLLKEIGDSIEAFGE
tara:strand:+ start:224 stop:586 length:363 start_codon:yes stop_codon:yes gene_type:complete